MTSLQRKERMQGTDFGTQRHSFLTDRFGLLPSTMASGPKSKFLESRTDIFSRILTMNQIFGTNKSGIDSIFYEKF